MDTHARSSLAISAVLLAGVAAACGSSSPPPTAEGSADAAGVSVTDFRGETVTLNAAPERIVITSSRQVLDELLMLEVAPVAYGADPAEELPPWTATALEESGAEVERLDATAGQLNLEQLAALRPDVIIANEFESDSFDSYEDIAPT